MRVILKVWGSTTGADKPDMATCILSGTEKCVVTRKQSTTAVKDCKIGVWYDGWGGLLFSMHKVQHTGFLQLAQATLRYLGYEKANKSAALTCSYILLQLYA